MNVVLTTDNIFLMQAHVEKGASIGIMTNSSLKRLALKKELAAVPLHFAYPSSVYCVYRRGHIEQALVDILVDMIYEFS